VKVERSMLDVERSAASYAATTDYLFSLKSAGVRFGVDRMARLAEALGHPERSYPVIHVAGTNGKGSVSAMLDAIFHAAGWRTGLYTSPHLVKLGERVQVDRRLLSEDEITAYTNELRPVAEKLGAAGPDEHPSFFEFMTAMAFLQFARRKVDVGIIEVGLGGRLDATTVVQPELAVITSIGFDHTEQLGDRLDLIAREKGGIIKEDRPVVMGRLPPEAEEVIRAIAAERKAPLHSVREVFGEELDGYPETNLEGDYQRWNAATATLAARVFGQDASVIARSPAARDDAAIHLDRHGPADAGPRDDKKAPDETSIARGLKHVSWPGRWQRMQIGGRLLILDASHNPEGAQVLESNLEHLFAGTGRKPVVVTGMLGAFRAKALLEVLGRHAKEIHLTPPHQERASSYEEMEACAPAEAGGLLHRTTIEAVFPGPSVCAVGGPEDIIVVTGSIYLIGEVLARIEPGRGAGEGRLQDF